MSRAGANRSRACSMCSHPEREELEAALAAGTPLREASETSASHGARSAATVSTALSLRG